MSSLHHSSKFHLRRLLAGALAVLSLSSAIAAAAPKYGNSLDWVPADAAFYSASLRMSEIVEIIANSNAWAKLTNLPSIQMGWQFMQSAINRPGGPGDQFQQFLADPENQQLWDLLVDGVSHEIMVYGDRTTADFLDVAQQTMNSMRFESLTHNVQKDSDSGPEDSEITNGRQILKSLDAHREKLAVPALVFGFKLTDVSRAKDQLARLEKLLQSSFEDEPKMHDRLRHSTVGGVDYLTLELDGGLVPWDEVPWEKLAEEPGQFDKLKEKLEQLKMVICAGVRGDYLLVSTGSSSDHLAKLGTGKLLAELPALKPLEKFAQQRLTGIGYESKDFMQALSSTDQQLDQLLQTLKVALPQAGLPDDLNQRIEKDAEEVANDLKKILPKPGDRMGFSFLNDHGVERYQYDWSQNLSVDGSKPLTVLDHLGGTPLLAAATREKYSPEQYEILRRWARKGFGYFEEFAVPQMTEEKRQEFEKIKTASLPLVERLDKATGEMLLPGLADGQSALVLDTKITSKRWFEKLPQDNRALPMFEPALVFGVSDAELVKKAFAEYQAVADAVVAEVKEFDPSAIPNNYKIPRPEVHESTSGADYAYKLPSHLGIDSQIAPNGGLNAHVAAISLVPAQTSRLLADAKLNVSPNGPLADRTRPLAGAFYFNWAATIDAATPWVEFAVRQFSAQSAAGAGIGMFLTDDVTRPELKPQEDDDANKFVLDQVHAVLDVLKVLRTIESASYFEDGAFVSHSVSEYHDVP